MDLQTLQSLLGWCLIINVGFYMAWAITMFGAREWLVRRQVIWFAVEPERARTTLYTLLAAYKVMILMFNFSPWLSVVIMNAT